ncbi:hypothetical protein D0T84_01075 [Dysgonomonas sp. 521]|uniref:hypothetical protein n=1 Tax=Dysgonomonas sp. 521 TaxID=2302932 RepID=UPI0013D159E1|nr:hypothetical protein [Dysgonomonas sp. 521]NDV93508.1 hypothetical protein [Dysgonomonas sp. 521]
MKNLKQLLEERLKTLDNAYAETGRPHIDFSFYPEDMREHEEACYNAKVIVEAARKIERECGLGEIDWNNHNQWKYTPWFWMSPAAFTFFFSRCDLTFAVAGSCSRLRVLSREASDHIGKTFPEIWEAVQLK